MSPPIKTVGTRLPDRPPRPSRVELRLISSARAPKKKGEPRPPRPAPIEAMRTLAVSAANARLQRARHRRAAQAAARRREDRRRRKAQASGRRR